MLLDTMREELLSLRDRVERLENELLTIKKLLFEERNREILAYYLRSRYYFIFKFKLMQALRRGIVHEEDLKRSS